MNFFLEPAIKLDRVINNKYVRVIRQGLIMAVPFIAAGAFALVLASIPIPIYQDFLANTMPGRVLANIFVNINRATLGFLAVLFSYTIGISIQREFSVEREDIRFVPAVTVACFIIAVGGLSEQFDISALGSSGVFIAIINASISGTVYIVLRRRIHGMKIFSDGATPIFDRALAALPTIGITLFLIGGIYYILCMCAGAENMWIMFSGALGRIFDHTGNGFWGGLVYVLITMFLWFFGIHGANVMESTNQNIFIPNDVANELAARAGEAIPNICTKSFIDTYVLMGGCGSTLCLVAAILLFSKRRSNRVLAKCSFVPMLFNVNEIIVFGLPIVYNLIFVIPFMLCPVLNYLIAYGAVEVGVVEPVTHTLEWTTPVFIGGWSVSGSVSGAILQGICVIAGTFIYLPFVKIYEIFQDKRDTQSIRDLVTAYRECEAKGEEVLFTSLEGDVGEVARLLVNDLQIAIERGKLYLLYQPQVDHKKKVIGAEALLRWKHPVFGYIYPPLIIKIAYEGGFLPELERYIFKCVKDKKKHYGDMKISVNISGVSLLNEDFISYLVAEFPGGICGKARICIEITERVRVNIDDEKIREAVKRLKDNGFMLAIDDFSMGQTSIAYLKNNQFDIVKFDGALIREIENDESVRSIVASLEELADHMGFSTVAEFVETEPQTEILKELGCEIYQGYYYSKPISVNELQKFKEHIEKKS